MRKLFVVVMSVISIFSFCTASLSQSLAGKKVLFVDSYHEGYAWGDGIISGIKTVLEGSGVELKIFRMDTKRNGEKAFKESAALKAKAEIEDFKPDVVIAGDDNASKYLVVPYYKDASLPFIFCGVNWDATGYGFPFKNVTGMLEVTPIPQLVEQLQLFAKGDRVGFLAPDVETALKEVENYKKVFGMTLTTYYAKDFEDYKKGFTELQSKVDMLIFHSDGGLYDDHAAEMKQFVEDNLKIPSGSAYDFMAPYALISYAKSPEEQGVWSAETAMKILGGQSPADIPIVKNTQGLLIINTRIAKILSAELPFELIQSADKVIE